jgi:hypothetical protein
MNNHPLFPVLVQTIETDIAQLAEFGVDPEPYYERLRGIAAEGSLDALAAYQEEVWATPTPSSYPYDEPSEPDAIRSAWPEPSTEPFAGTDSELRDRLAGGWLGRAAGCCLGKPLEMNLDFAQARHVCTALGGCPPLDYLTSWAPGQFPDPTGRHPNGRDRDCTKSHIACCPNDDDINYPLTSLICLERHGAEWTAEQLFRLLADITPYGRLWSSGKSGARAAMMGLPHPAGQLFGNPIRQSLGAMIRCDTWAYVSPGNLRQAAEFALRDAIYTQTRNGIYAGVFWTVALTSVLNGESPPAALRTAADYVPPTSKFAAMTAQAFSLAATKSWEEAIGSMYATHSSASVLPTRFHFNHAIINSAITMLAVLYGDGDFSRTIGLAVAAGRDTDCNGATAGSVLGLALGASGIPSHWLEPLHDTYRSDIVGCHDIRFSAIIERTHRLARDMGRFPVGE